MGLFNFFKKVEKNIVVPEADQKAVEWFFTKEAENTFYSYLVNKDEMYSIWFTKDGSSEMIWYIAPKDHIYRREYPCTFFADYLRALKTLDSPHLAVLASDLAIDGEFSEAIPYLDSLKAESNPLINFAIKIKPIFHSKNGKDLEFNIAMKTIIMYLHTVFVSMGIDESNEQWIYEKSFWFNTKGKVRNCFEIVEDIKVHVKRKDLIDKILKQI